MINCCSSKSSKDDDDESEDDDRSTDYSSRINLNGYGSYHAYNDYDNAEDNDLVDYATLLIGFYNTNTSVPAILQ